MAHTYAHAHTHTGSETCSALFISQLQCSKSDSVAMATSPRHREGSTRERGGKTDVRPTEGKRENVIQRGRKYF